ncbi:MAG TPA: asparagine synthase-related protein, partial [Longimicrobiales bacterium]|nr:asparagine synthase-related protein [Longimicrobiales bacterium]
MSAIAGIFSLDAPVEAGACDVLVRATGAGTPGSVRAEGRVAFANGSSHGVLRVDAAGRMLLADARIDNAAELRRMLGGSGVSVGDFSPASGTSGSSPDVSGFSGASNLAFAASGSSSVQEHRTMRDADLILAAYARWGERCTEHLVGDFAFALWDPARQSLFCARDPMGVRPFYYLQSDTRFCFAFDLRTLLQLRGAPAAFDRQRIIHFLLNTDAGRERTFYQDVRRLPAAHRLLRTPATLSLQRYWEPDVASEIRLRDDAEYAEAFRDLFAQAVHARLADQGPTAATLSGGLDSSSIVCMARQLLDAGAPLHTISLVFPDLPPDALRLIDERRYIETVTQGSGLTAHEVRGDRISPLADARRIVQTLHEPFSAPNLYLHWAMFGAAADAGCSVLLDGFDGDSAVSHGLGRLDDLLAGDDWATYEREVRAFAERRGTGVGRVARSFGVPRLDWLAATGRWVEWARTARALHRSFGLSRRDLLVEHGLGATRAGRRLRRPEVTAAGRMVRASHDDVALQTPAQP